MAENDSPRSHLPARVEGTTGASLDRRAVERVLARAAELHAGAYTGAEDAELISETQLAEIAQEVGLDRASLSQALAEERTRLALPEEHGWVGRTFGPARVAARRVIAGSTADLLATLDRRMQQEESLRVQRRFPERLVWEPRQDVWGKLRRSLGVGGHAYELAKARSVGATAAALDDARTLLVLEADLTAPRAAKLRWGAAAAGSGVALAALAVGLEFVVPAAGLIPLVGGPGVGWLVARGHLPFAAKVQLALEQALDRLEYGEKKPPPRTLASAIDSMTRPLFR